MDNKKVVKSILKQRTVPVDKPTEHTNDDTDNKDVQPDNQKHKSINASLLQSSIAEFKNQLHYHLSTVITELFNTKYRDALSEATKYKHVSETAPLRLFQEKLRKIPRYTTEQRDVIIKQLERKIKKFLRLDEVIRIIFVGKCMILASVRGKSSHANDLKIDVPSTTTFIYSVLKISARQLFTQPQLMRDSQSSEHLNKVVHNAIEDTLTSLLPHTQIIDTYLRDTIAAAEMKAQDNTSDVADTDLSIPKLVRQNAQTGSDCEYNNGVDEISDSSDASNNSDASSSSDSGMDSYSDVSDDDSDTNSSDDEDSSIPVTKDDDCSRP